MLNKVYERERERWILHASSEIAATILRYIIQDATLRLRAPRFIAVPSCRLYLVSISSRGRSSVTPPFSSVYPESVIVTFSRTRTATIDSKVSVNDLTARAYNIRIYGARVWLAARL